MTWFGIEIDEEINKSIHGKEAELSTKDSRVKVYVIPTDEEVMIARDVERLGNSLLSLCLLETKAF